ncbi:MAG: dihydrolipoyl dehydrogenase [Verrucomicrobiota bacterium]
MKDFYDIVVIGGGSAGYAAARTAVEDSEVSVALIEGGEQTAGLCILKGCMPTKALLESAHRLHEIKRASRFGLKVPAAEPNWKKIVKRKDALINEFSNYREQQQRGGKFDFIQGKARFLDEQSIEVTFRESGKSKVIKSKTFVIATGSRVAIPQAEGLDDVGFITSDEALHQIKPWKSLTVLGAGPVALELAQYFSHLGVNVKIIQRSGQFLSAGDSDVAQVLEKVFREEGMEVYTGTELLRFEKLKTKKGKPAKKRVRFKQGKKEVTVSSEEILCALGRRANTDSLDLEAAKVKTNSGRIRVRLTQQSSQKHIFAAGDVCGPYEVVHVAISQGELAAKNALALVQQGKSRKSPKLARMDYRLIMTVTFTNPEVATVGKSEKDLQAEKKDYLMATYPFDDHGKSMVMGALDGFVKLLADPKKGTILGAQIVGPHASDLIHELTALMAFKGTVYDLAKMPHYHPTLAEILTYPAEEIADCMAARSPRLKK